MTGSSAVPLGLSESSDDDAAGWRRLHADAVARLQSWEAPDDQQERLRLDFLEHHARAPRRHEQGRPSGSPHRQCHRARRGGRVGPAHAAPSGARVVPVRRPLRAGRRLGVARSEAGGPGGVGHTDISVLPPIVQLDRHVLAGDFGSCREHSTSGSRPCQHGLPRPPSARSRSTCGGGRSTPFPKAPGTTCDRSWTPLDAGSPADCADGWARRDGIRGRMPSGGAGGRAHSSLRSRPAAAETPWR